MRKKLNHTIDKRLLLFSAGTILGAVLFFIVYGFKVINPTYDDWIFSRGGDPVQHYLGWKFYRQSDLHFPVGLIDGLNGDGQTSFMFTDSIPLFAMFFKILSPVLPETFQYSGLWGLFCFCMMGGISSLLLRHFNKNAAFCLMGSVVFIISPTVNQRMFGHEGLAAHWIIATAILLWVNHNRKWKHKATPFILWSALGMISVLVHIYFLPMIYAVMLGYALTDIIQNKKIMHSVICCVSTAITAIFTMFVIGAFHGKGSITAGGLGIYSANYNSLFNPLDFSKFLKNLSSYEGQYEGYGYLGLGIIAAGIIALVILFFISEDKIHSLKDLKTEISGRYRIIIPISAVVAVSVFMAASPVGTLNEKVIYTINYPKIITAALSIFRASGRFIWIVDYIIYTAVFAVIAKSGKPKTIIFITALCMCIQIFDLSDMISSNHKKFTKTREYVSVLDDSLEEIAYGTNEIVFLPLPEDFNAYFKMYFTFGEYASRYNMKLSSFYTARPDYDALSEYAGNEYQKLLDGNGEENILYVFFNKDEVPKSNKNLHVYEVEDYIVARYKNLFS